MYLNQLKCFLRQRDIRKISYLVQMKIIENNQKLKNNFPGLGLIYFCIWTAIEENIPRFLVFNTKGWLCKIVFFKWVTISFFNKVYALFLFVILKCHMVVDTNPQYVAIVLSDLSWKKHNYTNGDLTFHSALMDCFLSTFLIKENCMKCYYWSCRKTSCLGKEESSGRNQVFHQLPIQHTE